MGWKFGDHCLKCTDLGYSKNSSSISPLWDIPAICRNCDMEP
jgi:hypothetical protein